VILLVGSFVETFFVVRGGEVDVGAAVSGSASSVIGSSSLRVVVVMIINLD
jgi:hypothetical protein